MNPVAEDILMHYGMPRRSGRYPWGSGENPNQHGSEDFLSRVERLKKNGWTETAENIRKEFGENVTLRDYRNEKAWCNYERRLYQVETAKRLRDKEKLGATDIGRKMGIPESTVRSLLNEESEARMRKAKETADFLRDLVDKEGMIDVGTGTERELNISKERLDLALYALEGEGYPVWKGGIPQVTNPGQQTNQKVLCVPGTPHKAIYEFDKVKTIKEYVSHDGGETFDKFVYPKSMDSKRLMIRYDEDGGSLKDGIVEIRRGVDDLSLGDSHYSQVRILVDDKKYIKGMAVYSDDMPDGVDVIFNTNKTKDKSKLEVLKDIKDDPDNPFGSLIKAGGQSYYTDKDGNRQLSLINKRADEGDWSEWKDALPSQFLGKQSKTMINKQLNLAKADKLAEYDEICSLTNPTVKKHLLQKFADECDSAAVHLQAAALPGQKYHVIIPVNTLKDNEVYAPNYKNGEKIALIRYPHGGTFEIPILTVNNKHVPAKNLIGTDTIDAIGINKKNADRLSGADFDGDTVMCIPTHDKANKVKVTSTDELPGLKGFDPKLHYGADKITKDADGTEHAYVNGREFKIMRNTGKEMGVISNLITDMTLLGADSRELAAAVRHSMVVIDAEKHKLDYKRSEVENNIDALKRKYQVRDGGYGGASTLLSRSKGEVSVEKRQGTPKINLKGKEWYDPSKPEGAYIYKTADDLYYPDRSYDKATKTVTLRTIDGKRVQYNMDDRTAVAKYEPVENTDPKTGKVTFTSRDGEITYRAKTRLEKSTRMAEADDAQELLSKARNPKEVAYAEYANSMKTLANRARKEMATTGRIEYSSTAKAAYQTEVDSLNKKLNTALLNTTRERAAQRQANYEISVKKANNPDMKKDEIKKASQQALTSARLSVGSVARRDRNIDITDKEWEAIQAGAISESQLKKILNNTDTAALRERATPRTSSTLSSAKVNRIKAMSSSNYSLSEIADALGVSTSTVSKYLKGAA